MWPKTSISYQKKPEWWEKPLRSLRLLERVKTKYKSQFNGGSLGNRRSRTFAHASGTGEREEIGTRTPEPAFIQTATGKLFLTENYSRFGQFNSSKLSVRSRVLKLELYKQLPLQTLKSSHGAEIQNFGKRVVEITGLSDKMNVPLVLSQLRGGALEKVVYHENNPKLELYFLSSLKAAEFMAYACKTGFFVVNGSLLVVEWGISPEAHNCEFSPLPRYLLDEVEIQRASRVLVLSKPIPGKPLGDKGGKKVYPNPRDNFSSDFNIEEVKWDFVRFGGIVEVCPMISHRLSVSIQFTDIRSALLVMRSMKQRESHIGTKYADWSVKYGSDPAQRPCYAI